MDKETFRKLLKQAPTKKPQAGTVNWSLVYAEALKTNKVYTTKAFHNEIVKEEVNIGRTKMKLHEWADEVPPKVARIWTGTTYLWSFDPEDVVTYAQRA